MKCKTNLNYMKVFINCNCPLFDVNFRLKNKIIIFYEF